MAEEQYSDDIEDSAEHAHGKGENAEKRAVSCSVQGNTERFTTIQRDMPTRWNSVLIMVSSFIKNQEVIRRILENNRMYDKILTERDMELATNLKQALDFFKMTTEIFQGTLYPTIKLAILFRSELIMSLQVSPNDSEMLQHMKQRLLEHMNSRFPVTEEMGCAALLDPAMKRLSALDDYFRDKAENKVEFITRMMSEYCGEGELLIATPKDTGEPLSKKPNFGELIEKLLQKHSTTSFSTSVEVEIRKYLVVSSSNTKVLDWRKSNGSAFPRIAILAKNVLNIPLTSAPSERKFSAAGLLITAKRSSLDPLKVKRTLFIHNFQLTKDVDGICKHDN